MKMIGCYRVAAAIAMAALAASGTASAQDQNFADAQARLGLSLASAAAAEPEARGRNLVISPFSLGSVLALIRGGFTNEARDALAEEMGIDSEDELRAFLKLSEEMDGTDELALAAGVWFDRRVRPNDYVVNSFRDTYRRPIETLDMASRDAVAIINAWAAEKTNGAIKEAIRDLPSGSEIVGASALYFKANWERAFDPAATKKAPFTPAVGPARDVDFMTRAGGRTLYREDEAFKAVDLPYRGGRFSMVVLLPNRPVQERALQQVVSFRQQPNADAFLSWLRGENFTARPGSFELPKFTLSTTFDYLPALSRQLSGDQNRRRVRPQPLTLYGIAPSAELSELRQVATMTVDEEGTEAAATTVASGSRGISAAPDDAFSVLFNKPFIVALRDTQTKMLLFIGLVQTVGEERAAAVAAPTQAASGRRGRSN